MESDGIARLESRRGRERKRRHSLSIYLRLLSWKKNCEFSSNEKRSTKMEKWVKRKTFVNQFYSNRDEGKDRKQQHIAHRIPCAGDSRVFAIPCSAQTSILSRNRKILWIIIMFNVHVYIQVIYWRLSARRHVFIRVLSLSLWPYQQTALSSGRKGGHRASYHFWSVGWRRMKNPSFVALVSGMHASCAFAFFLLRSRMLSLAVTVRMCSI